MDNVDVTPPVIVRRPGEGIGRPGRLGAVAQRKVLGADTRGAYYLGEQTVPPGWRGPLPHLHDNAEEAFYVLRGAFRFRLGDEEVDGSAGTFVLVPRGTIHAFWNPHDEPATMLSIVSPPVLEGSFEAFVIYCSPGRRVRSTWMRSRPTIAASALSSHVAAMSWR